MNCPIPSQWPVNQTLGALAALTRGRIVRGAHDCRVPALVHDTREDVRGAMFVAIAGENFDGHAFVARAAESGALGALVSREVDTAGLPAEFFVLRVDDTVQALGDLASARRAAFAGPVIAVAGSSGKTTTKDMIAHVLSGRYRVHKTTGNFNNLIGLPLTLLGLCDAHQAAVVELGMNQPGELERLTQIAAPTHAVLTNIGLAHVGMFATEEDLIKAKAAFVIHAPARAVIVFNDDCPRSRRVLREHAAGRRALSVGSQAGADVEIRDVEATADGYRFALDLGGALWKAWLPGFGRYNLHNAAMAAAIAREMGVSGEEFAEALARFQPHALRSQIVTAGGVRIIADCYNANPDSMAAALRSLLETPCDGRRFAVLGDMLELGSGALEIHARIGKMAAEAAGAAGGLDLLVSVGDLSRALSDAARQSGLETAHVGEAVEAATRIAARVRPGDVVLFKGSRRMKLEDAVTALCQTLNARIEPSCCC